jgi:hypothetical protein
MSKQTSKLNPQWVREALSSFKEFLRLTQFPHPVRNGVRGSEFDYPEWLIMFIAVLAVKSKTKTYLGIHRAAIQYWKIIARGTPVMDRPISERQLRDRLKKISYHLGKTPVFVLQIFPQHFLD